MAQPSFHRGPWPVGSPERSKTTSSVASATAMVIPCLIMFYIAILAGIIPVWRTKLRVGNLKNYCKKMTKMESWSSATILQQNEIMISWSSWFRSFSVIIARASKTSGMRELNVRRPLSCDIRDGCRIRGWKAERILQGPLGHRPKLPYNLTNYISRIHGGCNYS